MFDLGHDEARVLLWALVLAVAALMAWRLWQVLGRRHSPRPWYRYWYYAPLFLILGWVVGQGGIPDYWERPLVYLRTVGFWIGLCFLVGETVNWLVEVGLRAARRYSRRRRGRRPAGR